MPIPSVAVLKITLDDVEPAVMRRVVVPANVHLDRLHLMIQAAMGWTNSHLYEFQIGGANWGELDPDGFYDDPLEAKSGRLSAVLADAGCKTFTYLYDFGDGWSHTVKLEKIAPGIEGDTNLILLDAVGRCPPEDCGGVGGYENLLQILADPDHREHEETLTWCGGSFAPSPLDSRTFQLLKRRSNASPAAGPHAPAPQLSRAPRLHTPGAHRTRTFDVL